MSATELEYAQVDLTLNNNLTLIAGHFLLPFAPFGARVAALIDKLQGVNAKRESREDEMTTLKSAFAKTFRDTVGPQVALLDAIREALPDDGIYVEELTQLG